MLYTLILGGAAATSAAFAFLAYDLWDLRPVSSLPRDAVRIATGSGLLALGLAMGGVL